MYYTHYAIEIRMTVYRASCRRCCNVDACVLFPILKPLFGTELLGCVEDFNFSEVSLILSCRDEDPFHTVFIQKNNAKTIF